MTTGAAAAGLGFRSANARLRQWGASRCMLPSLIQHDAKVAGCESSVMGRVVVRWKGKVTGEPRMLVAERERDGAVARRC